MAYNGLWDHLSYKTLNEVDITCYHSDRQGSIRSNEIWRYIFQKRHYFKMTINNMMITLMTISVSLWTFPLSFLYWYLCLPQSSSSGFCLCDIHPCYNTLSYECFLIATVTSYWDWPIVLWLANNNWNAIII